MWIWGMYLLVGGMVLSLLFTPIVKKLAILVGAVDTPNARKVHARVMPRMGGVAIFASFALVYTIFLFFTDHNLNQTNMAVIFGGAIIVMTGVLDDLYQISPKQKLLGQLVASVLVVCLDIRLEHINLPFLKHPLELGWFSYPITVFWIIGITNAVNLIDGLDGLACGVSTIAAISLTIISLMVGNVFIACLCLAFIGSLLGFLRYNFNPASIFMGDAGSLFLGFFLATTSLISFKQVAIVSFVIPVLLLAVPISDTFYAMLRRKMNRLPISSPDKNHLHHRLLAMGLSHKQTVLTIYSMSIVFSACAVWTTHIALWSSLIVFILYVLVFHVIADCLGMMKTDSFLYRWIQGIRQK